MSALVVWTMLVIAHGSGSSDSPAMTTLGPFPTKQACQYASQAVPTMMGDWVTITVVCVPHGVSK